MFSESDRPHPNWEMPGSSQRRISILALMIVIALFVIDFVSGSPYRFWNAPPSDEKLTQMAANL